MADISLTFPDGNARSFAAGVTPAEVASSISTSLGDFHNLHLNIDLGFMDYLL